MGWENEERAIDGRRFRRTVVKVRAEFTTKSIRFESLGGEIGFLIRESEL